MNKDIKINLMENTEIDALMYHSNIISKDSYDFMKNLKEMPEVIQTFIFMNILIEDISNPLKYKIFKESLKNNSKMLHYKINFVG